MTDSNPPDLGPTDRARRRLVRGAFAVPAVLTLQSGGASAATSSAAKCLANQNQNPVSFAPTSSDDSYFRYRLWVIRKKTDNTIDSAWVRGADLSVYVRNGQMPFLDSSSWQGFAIASNALSGSVITTMPSPNGAENSLEQTGPWVVLRVNSTGALVGAGVSGSGSSVADTCWNSFALGTTA